MTDPSALLKDLTDAARGALPALDATREVLAAAYAVLQELTPLLVLLLCLLLVRWERRIRAMARRQEHQTRTLVKLLNLHPDSDYQQYVRLAERRARERERRAETARPPRKD